MYTLNPADILSVVCEVCNVNIKEVKSSCRKREIVTARHIYAYIACKYGLQRKAHLNIKRDNSVIPYGKRKIETYLQQPVEMELQRRVRNITQLLRPYAECMPCIGTGICKYINGFHIDTIKP